MNFRRGPEIKYLKSASRKIYVFKRVSAFLLATSLEHVNFRRGSDIKNSKFAWWKVYVFGKCEFQTWARNNKNQNRLGEKYMFSKGFQISSQLQALIRGWASGRAGARASARAGGAPSLPQGHEGYPWTWPRPWESSPLQQMRSTKKLRSWKGTLQGQDRPCAPRHVVWVRFRTLS